MRAELLAKVVGDWDGDRVQREVTITRKQFAPYLRGEKMQWEHPDYWQGINEINRFAPPS